MQVDPVDALIAQYRETMEGKVGSWHWITDGTPESAVLGFLETLTPQQAFAEPAPGARSVAAHVKHLHFSLDLFAKRMGGDDPPADWTRSFDLSGTSPADWAALKADLRRTYDQTLAIVEKQRKIPLAEWPGIYHAGLAATIAHNAYHLGAIRQIGRVVSER